MRKNLCLTIYAAEIPPICRQHHESPPVGVFTSAGGIYRTKLQLYNFPRHWNGGTDSSVFCLFIIKIRKRRSEQNWLEKKSKSVRNMANVYTNYESESPATVFAPQLCIFERLPYWKINQLPCAFVRYEIRYM